MYSIWYGETLKVDKEVFPPFFKAGEKQDFLIDHVAYIRRKRQMAQKKRKDTLEKNKIDKLIKTPKIVERRDYIERERYKELNNPNMGKFRVKKHDIKFKVPMLVDPKNEQEIEDACREIRRLYDENFGRILDEATEKSPEDYKNRFIFTMLLPRLDDNFQLTDDRVVATFDIDQAEEAVIFHGGRSDWDIIEKEYSIAGELVPKILVVKKFDTGVELKKSKKYFNMTGISRARSEILDPAFGDFTIDKLIETFKEKAQEYLTRNYAPVGAVAGLSFEYITDVFLD
jgi:hypothetical protein